MERVYSNLVADQTRLTTTINQAAYHRLAAKLLVKKAMSVQSHHATNNRIPKTTAMKLTIQTPVRSDWTIIGIGSS